MDRRTFLAAGAAALLPPRRATAAANVKFGVDLFSIRSQGWTPIQYLDYCAKWNVKVVHFSEIRFIGSLEPENLKKVRAHAAELGIQVEIGMRSICPTSTMFDPKQGTAEEQLTRMITAAVDRRIADRALRARQFGRPHRPAAASKRTSKTP